MRKFGLVFVSLLLVLVGSAGLMHLASRHLGESSAGGTLQSGRSVMASSDSWYLMCDNTPDTATIKTAGKTIVVAPDKVMVDGQQIATFEAAASDVEVHVKDGQIEIVADGTPVGRVAR